MKKNSVINPDFKNSFIKNLTFKRNNVLVLLKLQNIFDEIYNETKMQQLIFTHLLI